jgi:hypothetical protein
MTYLYQETLRVLSRLSAEEYLLLFVVTMSLGVLCLRGFGSRSRY